MAKYSIGQKVKVVNIDRLYPTYHDWVTDNKLCMLDTRIRELWAKYLANSHNDCDYGTELIIVAYGVHGVFKDTVMCLCADTKGNPVLIDEEGLAPVEEGLKWTDLKIGDVIRSKVSGNQYMVIGKDDSENTTTHIYVGTSWRTDSELSDRWEKVE